MTIDEAILLERETVRRNKMMLELNKLMQESHAVCFDKLKRETSIRIHEQLAEWLELLKWYEQGMEDIPSESGVLPKDVYHAGYNKALDDFANTLKENYDYLPQIFSQEAFGRYVDEYAEQLKAGVED